MSCFFTSKPHVLEPSKNTFFDNLLLDGFTRIAAAGDVLRTKPSEIKRRPLDGIMGIVAQHSPEHFSKKRKPNSSHQQVVEPNDPEAFNFTKVDNAERIGVIQVSMPEGKGAAVPTMVLANASPLANGHVLLVPNSDQLLPQVLNEELILCGLQILQRSGRHDFRLVFNSLMGFASVNHFHFHGLFLGFCGMPGNRLPIEKVERSVIAGDFTEGKVAVELILETQWYSKGFVLSAGCREGTPGENPAGDVEALAAFAGRFVRELQKNNIAHNVMLRPPQNLRTKAKSADLMAHEEAKKPFSICPEVFILPRKPEASLRKDAGFNAAIMEMAGLIVAHGEEEFQAFTEEQLKNTFKEDVTLDPAVFDDLICKAAWLCM